MSEKRKANKGRILKAGESQRKDGIYMYRYADIRGKRRYIYSPTLDGLREQENDVQRDVNDGIDCSAGEITVIELLKRYMGMKRGLSVNTLDSYGAMINQISRDEIGLRQIKSIKPSEVKNWFLMMHDNGLKRGSLIAFQNLIRPAFEMAVEDDIIRKNPFRLRLSDFIPQDATKRQALTKVQQEQYLSFVLEDNGNFYDDIVILIGTGIRVSELYGLTEPDIDFENRCVKVRRQLCHIARIPYFVTTPKSESGIRDIPMTQKVYEAFRRVIQNRGKPKIEMVIDGYGGFIFLNIKGRPKVAIHLENYMARITKEYVKKHGNTLPKVTPHVLRHTFCTNAQQAGIDIKSLQYLMGHTNASISLDVYSHVDYHAVVNAFGKVAADL